MSGHILIVDDEANVRKTIEMIHRNAGWETATAGGGAEALELLQCGRYDVVFLDLGMPDRDGLDVMKDIKLHRPDQVIVILTGQGTIEKAVEATRLGAFDFLEKDCGKDKILLTSKNAFEKARMAEENRRLREQISKKQEYLGTGDKAREVMEQINKVSPTNARVLILGESGTGKELIAQAIHDRSRRAAGPFVKVNCAAIPEELIEAELFGSERGAYTGSVGTREGKFQAAHGGTIFLDEVGDMSERVQTKVLRAIQEGEIERVGSDKVIKVDVRVIAATNKDLIAEVSRGRFREDLYFRLNVVPINAPALRERPDDIQQMAELFLAQYCAENDLPPKRFEPKVIQLLLRYPWPGNVRELRNQVERMVIMAPGKDVRIEDCSAEIRAGVPPAALSRRGERVEDVERALAATSQETGGDGTSAVAVRARTLQEARKEFERKMIREALERNDWNVSRAADELGLERTNLHKKIKQLGLSRK
ncbi:MAG: sigma-54 dependent transcriptional regulator [Candidatus Latescibacterota bacterium]|jgi:two-component system nitrogen regulation response regulator NtrX